jgi:WD40 repeat protein
MNSTEDNPYVGPQPFQESERERFFGRKREANELLALVLSEQEVVFYAQSGAGKSSLVNTCLIPDLKKKGFQVLLGRVSGDAPAGLEVDNIFVFNLLRSLSTSRVDLQSLTNLSLSDFLTSGADIPSASDGRASSRRALVIDQFEEIFSRHHQAWEKRQDFFEQLAQALEDDPRLRMILVMREDFIASLDPYAYILPSRLRMRYFMQRLEYPAALEAVTEPVKGKNFSRPYTEGAAEKLVDDLRTIQVINPDGKSDVGTGQFVEPLYLQVICYELWSNLPHDGTTITTENVQKVGDVSTSLGNYYARRVAAVAEAEKVNEGKIRKWFTDKLISPTGIRNMVLQEPGETSANLENRVIRALSDLVRAEQRGGAIFYELTHDRLARPIIDSNLKWFDEHLSPLQKQAALWDGQGRTDRWLLSDQALIEVEQWAREHQDELMEVEKEFLEACQKQEEQIIAEREAQRRELEIAQKLADEQVRFAQEQALANTRIRKALRTSTIIAGIASLLLVIAIILGIQSYQNQRNTQMQVLVGASSEALAKGDSDLATLLAYQALITYGDHGESEEALGNIVKPIKKEDPITVPFMMSDTGDAQNDVTAVGVSPDGNTLASGDLNGTITLWNLQNSQFIGELPSTNNKITSIAFSPDGKALASASYTTIVLWNVSNPTKPLEIAQLVGHSDTIYTVAFSSDGRTLASASADKTIILWDLSNPTTPSQLATLTGHKDVIWGVAFSPDGKTLASGSWDDSSILWDVSDPTRPSMIATLKEHSADVESVAFSPDGTILASVSDDTTIILWNTTTHQPIGQPLSGHTAIVRYVAFNPDGRIIASRSDDGEIILWDIGDPTQPHILATLYGNSGNGNNGNVVFTPDGKELVSGSSSGIVWWDMNTPVQPVQLQALTKPTYGNVTRVNSMSLISGGKTLAALGADNVPVLFDMKSYKSTRLILTSADTGKITRVIFSPDGKYVASRDDHIGYIRVWEAATGKFLAQIDQFGFEIIAAFSPDGKYLVSVGYDGTATVWEISSGNEIAHVKHGSNVTAVAFSPDGKYVASAGDNKPILIWDARSGKKIARIPYKGYVSSIAFSPDGTRLAIALADDKRSVEIWDLETKQEILVIANGELKTLNYSVAGAINLKNQSKPQVDKQQEGPSRISSLSYSQEGLSILYQNGVIDHWELWPSRAELKKYAESVCGACELKYAQRLEYELYTWPMRVPDYAGYIILILNLACYGFCIWTIRRTVFAKSTNQNKTQGSSWKKLWSASMQGTLFVLFSLITWVLIGFFEPIFYRDTTRFPDETILWLSLFALPLGMWAGGAYNHFTRLESGKWSRTKRSLMATLSGFLAGLLAGLLGLVALAYAIDELNSMFSDPTVFIAALICGGAAALMSLFGALIYIFGLSPWVEGTVRPKTVKDWSQIWWARGIAVLIVGIGLGYALNYFDQGYIDAETNLMINVASIILGVFGFMFYPNRHSYILTAILGIICTFIWLSNFDSVPISIWLGLGSGFILSAIISRILHAMKKI